MRNIFGLGAAAILAAQPLSLPVLTEEEYKKQLEFEAVREPRVQVTAPSIQVSIPRKPKKDKSHLKRGSSYFNRK